ncbi:hypothetical protein FBU30_006017 [Linnemannia zychae]|nr:hypothetical protein FBU30_006017 [Linnemannia zychae]
MAKIFSVSPAELNALRDRTAGYPHPDSTSSLLSDVYSETSSCPSSPTDTQPSILYSSYHYTSITHCSSSTTGATNDISKIVLSFFLSPTGYHFLRFDRKSKPRNSKLATNTTADASDSTAKIKKSRISSTSATLSHNILQRLNTSLVDPEEYEQWFKSQINCYNSPSATVSINHNRVYANTMPVGRNIAALSSATRAGIRGLTLAFFAGTVIDVVLPALLKQKFHGLLKRILANPSSLRMGASCGLFAFLYKFSFHMIAFALDYISFKRNLQPVSSKRSDSGIGLGDKQRIERIQIENLPKTNSADDEDQEKDSNSNTTQSNSKDQAWLRSKKWITAIVATLVAAPAYSLIPDKARQLTMALYFLTYAGESVYAALQHSGKAKWMPSWLGLWILAPISTSIIIQSFIADTECCPSQWVKLIQIYGDPFVNKPKKWDTKTLGAFPSPEHCMNVFKRYINAGSNSRPVFTSASVSTAAAALTGGSGFANQFLVPEACENVFKFTESMNHNSNTCRIFHPNDGSCSKSLQHLMRRHWFFMFKMYSLLAAISFIARGGNVFQKGVMNYFTKTFKATLRSTMSNWSFVTVSFALICGLDRALPSWCLSTKRFYLNGFIGGFFNLLETPARQSTLTLYFTRFMLETVWRRMEKARIVKSFKGGETVLFGLAMSIVMGVYETQPGLKRKTYIQSMLDKIFVD